MDRGYITTSLNLFLNLSYKLIIFIIIFFILLSNGSYYIKKKYCQPQIYQLYLEKGRSQCPGYTTGILLVYYI